MLTSPADLARAGRFWLRGAVDARGCAALAGMAPVDAQWVGPGDPLFSQAESWLPSIVAHWPGYRPVRAVAFNKRARNNWAVAWHQDRVIAVTERRDVPGFDGWTRRGDYWHCTAPPSVLADMLFVRVHLDHTDEAAGGMDIARGSHRLGVVRSNAVEVALAHCEFEGTDAAPGDILVLPLLTLHRSKPSASRGARRVLRFDLARYDLPGGVRWAVVAR